MEPAIINKVVVGETEVHGSVEVKTRCGQGRIVPLQLALCNRHGLIHQDAREKKPRHHNIQAFELAILPGPRFSGQSQHHL